MNTKRVAAVVGTVAVLGLFGLAACGEAGSPPVDGVEVSNSTSALIGPDQDLSDFPPWIWPVIQPADVLAQVARGQLSFDRAAGVLKQLVTKVCACQGQTKQGVAQLLAVMDASFEAQHAALVLAKAGVGGSGSVGYDDDDWCGTPPKPWPWPWPVLDLVSLQAEMFSDLIAGQHRLSKTQAVELESRLKHHVGRFETLIR